MPAPLGNQFWRLRSKHGRDRIFSNPDDLWEAACEYFEWCDNNPFEELDYRGKDASPVTLYKMRAYTIRELCLHLDCNTQWLNQFKKAVSESDKQIDKDFYLIITRIEDVIYTQKFTGSAAGLLVATIISRELGLAEKQEVKVDSFDVTLNLK